MKKDELIQQLINAYSDAYQNLGYSSLMGKIVGLLLTTPDPLSLDDITERLQMSKGPVSQIARKLKDHHLIEKVWVPGERKDYYKATSDIFGQAFANYASSMKKNMELGRMLQEAAEQVPDADTDSAHIAERMYEMKIFYELMGVYNKKFLEAWRNEVKPKINLKT